MNNTPSVHTQNTNSIEHIIEALQSEEMVGVIANAIFSADKTINDGNSSLRDFNDATREQFNEYAKAAIQAIVEHIKER